jgi:hypothetical protein
MGLPNRDPDGEFTTFQHWVNYATRCIGGRNAACYDAKGRRCLIGKDFMLARDEGAFPVRYWYGEGGQTAKEQKKSIKAYHATMKANFPWRYQ